MIALEFDYLPYIYLFVEPGLPWTKIFSVGLM